MKRQALLVMAVAILLRLPFLNQAVQGDDLYYLYAAQHAQVDPLHPLHTHYVFRGQMMDVRGHPHGPLDPWILGALVATFGGVRELPFHAAYIVFSLMAAWAMLGLARRFCPEQALPATLLFLAVPAFVVNGTSFETDLPFLAFWLISILYQLRAVDTKNVWLLGVSAGAAAIAALDATQAVVLTPILGYYMWQQQPRARNWLPGWVAIFAAPATIVAWQSWEWWTSGVFPIQVLLGYVHSRAFESTQNKIGSAIALTVHAAWIVFPALIVIAFGKSAGPWRRGAAAVAAVAAVYYDGANPLFWVSIGMGVLLIGMCLRREFLSAWIAIFFLASVAIFFAGSARYLLPIAAPVAIIIAREVRRPWLLAGFAVQLTISLGLAAENYQHWGAVRDFAHQVLAQANGRRIWVNGEWGLRHYLEDGGALPLQRDTVPRGGDIIVTSDLGPAFTWTGPTARLLETTISPSIPLRVLSMNGHSGYSSSSKGLLPFEIGRGIVDRLHADVVTELKPELSYLDPKDPRAVAHIVQGLFPDGWMTNEANVVLKVPAHVASLGVSFYIAPNAPAHRIALLADGRVVAENTYPGPGLYSLAVPFHTDAMQMTVGLRVDATYKAPGDDRDLGVVVVGVGFR